MTGTASIESAIRPENPAAPPSAAAAPSAAHEVLAVYRQWLTSITALRAAAQALCARLPGDRDAHLLYAEILRGAGADDLACAEFEALLPDCPPNELHRVQQGLAQCRADRSYFPPEFAARLASGEFVDGQNSAVWRDYAWREIQRGREIVRTLRQVAPLRGKRALDVGSGYGGMLIALAEQGAEATGVEIDPERAGMGRRRLADLGMDIPYHLADITAPGTAAAFGSFDLIVCQDVLEHVLDPSGVIRSLCSILRPGGIIYIQIPNHFGVEQLMSDHHYALTGITALSRPQAIEYWTLATGEPAGNYGVGYERGEKFYASAFARCGVALHPVDRYSHLDHVLWYAPLVSQMCKRLERDIFPGLRPQLRDRIRRRMTKVARLYTHASQQIMALSGQPALMAEACDSVVRRLCLGLWRFIGVKNSAGGSA